MIDIDARRLPSPAIVQGWSAEEFVAALRHDPRNPAFNASLRQLIHVGYKIAAQMGERYLRLLETLRSNRRQKRDGQPLRAPLEAAVFGDNKWVGVGWHALRYSEGRGSVPDHALRSTSGRATHLHITDV